MGLDLPSGGHLTHGYYTLNKATKTKMSISATSIYFESLPYTVHPETGLVDFERLDDLAGVFKPNLIVCGGSAYPRDWDYKRFREIADKNGSLLLCDMAHYAGLVAAGELSSPFDVCDVVTTTTHKSLRGPRAGIIFFRKDERNFGARINAAVFPSLQGGPHINQIAAIATQFKEVATPEFRAYAKQVRANARALAAALTAKGYTIATGGTDNHLMLWDLRPQGVTGSKMQKMCDRVSITLNMNAVYGDRSALSPGGVRVGTPALTTRGFVEADFEQVAEFLHRACVLALEVQAALPSKLLADFVKAIEANEAADKLRDDIHAFASRFPMPGFDVDSLRIKDL
jgi:glycine hydroxymethyltransferase